MDTINDTTKIVIEKTRQTYLYKHESESTLQPLPEPIIESKIMKQQIWSNPEMIGEDSIAEDALNRAESPVGETCRETSRKTRSQSRETSKETRFPSRKTSRETRSPCNVSLKPDPPSNTKEITVQPGSQSQPFDVGQAKQRAFEARKPNEGPRGKKNNVDWASRNGEGIGGSAKSADKMKKESAEEVAKREKKRSEFLFDKNANKRQLDYSNDQQKEEIHFDEFDPISQRHYGVSKAGLVRVIVKFSEKPKPHPTFACFNYPGTILSHSMVLDAILKSLDRAAVVKSLHFVDRNTTHGAQGIDNRWIVQLDSVEATDALVDGGLLLYNRHVVVLKYDHVLADEYDEYREYTRQQKRLYNKKSEQAIPLA